MPSHLLHLTLDELLFGKGHTHKDVHKYMDQMQPLMQSNHRKYFHDMQTVNDIYAMTRDKEAAMSAYFHIILDNISDEVGQERSIAELLDRLNRGLIKC